METLVYLVVALGNPGPEYQFHRHNAGFMVGEELRRRHGLPTLRSKFQGLIAEGRIGGKKVVLLLPTTFMNLSGRAAAEAARFYKVPADRMLVIHDEVELPFGEVRLKEGQGLGASGHQDEITSISRWEIFGELKTPPLNRIASGRANAFPPGSSWSAVKPAAACWRRNAARWRVMAGSCA